MREAYPVGVSFSASRALPLIVSHASQRSLLRSLVSGLECFALGSLTCFRSLLGSLISSFMRLALCSLPCFRSLLGSLVSGLEFFALCSPPCFRSLLKPLSSCLFGLVLGRLVCISSFVGGFKVSFLRFGLNVTSTVVEDTTKRDIRRGEEEKAVQQRTRRKKEGEGRDTQPHLHLLAWPSVQSHPTCPSQERTSFL